MGQSAATMQTLWPLLLFKDAQRKVTPWWVADHEVAFTTIPSPLPISTMQGPQPSSLQLPTSLCFLEFLYHEGLLGAKCRFLLYHNVRLGLKQK